MGWNLCEGPTLETLDFTIRIGSTPTFLYLIDLYLNTAYTAHCIYFMFRTGVFTYRKPLNISLGLIFVRKHFLVGLYMEGLIFGGLRYVKDSLAVPALIHFSLGKISDFVLSCMDLVLIFFPF